MNHCLGIFRATIRAIIRGLIRAIHLPGKMFDIKCIFRFFSLSKISNRLFYLFQILKIGKNDLLAMEHTLLHLATVPGVTKGVFYFMAVPLEDDTWCVR